MFCIVVNFWTNFNHVDKYLYVINLELYHVFLIQPSLESIIQLGAVFPCKVIEVSQDNLKKKHKIILSINPEEVNSNLKPSSLYHKMVCD